MARLPVQLSREEIAWREVGVTDISPGWARLLTAAFLLLIATVPALQQFLDSRGPAPRSALAELARLPGPEAADPGLLAANRRLLAHIQGWEDLVEENAFLRRLCLGPWQEAFSALGLGNEQAWIGRDGWLYYRPDVETLTGPPFDPAPPRQVVLDLRDQLAARDIHLVVMPIPPKPGVVYTPLGLPPLGRDVVLQNPSFAAWLDSLRAAGVPVFDPTPVLAAAESARPGSAYLKTDTHWTPPALEVVAEALTRFLATRSLLPPPVPVAGYHRDTRTVTNRGDIAVMLRPPDGLRGYPPESVVIHPVRKIDGTAWSPSTDAALLVLGDSFTNIYSDPALRWGAGAGLAEQIAFILQRPVDAIVLNDHGARATREALSQELAAGHDRLAGKQVVIWAFAARELSFGDWRSLPLSVGQPAPPGDTFWTPAAGQAVRARATVRAASPVPRPGSVPYADHVRMLWLTDLRSAEGAPLAEQAVAYAASMTAHRRTAAGGWHPGETVEVTLRPWAELEATFGALNRSELDGDAFLLAEPVWAEPAATAAAPPTALAAPVAVLAALALLAVINLLRLDRAARLHSPGAAPAGAP